MNILIDNYVTPSQTESMYLYHSLKNMNGINAYFWPTKKISAYDIFDDTKPDIFITHISLFDFEIMTYLTDNDLDIPIVLSLLETTVAYQESVRKQLVDINESNITKNLFVLSSKKGDNSTGMKEIVLPHCADTNISDYIKLENKIPVAYFINSEKVKEEKEGSYHYISNNIESADVCLAENVLASMMSIYEEIVFEDLKRFDQPFFDALLKCDKVSYKSSDKKLDELSEKIFGDILNCNNSNNVDYKKVKEIVNKKHLPYNRVKTLLSQLPINQNIFTEV